MTLNRYEHEQIKNQIDGYMIGRRPGESFEIYFERSKAELISNLEKHIELVKSFDQSDFLKKDK